MYVYVCCTRTVKKRYITLIYHLSRIEPVPTFARVAVSKDKRHAIKDHVDRAWTVNRSIKSPNTVTTHDVCDVRMPVSRKRQSMAMIPERPFPSPPCEESENS